MAKERVVLLIDDEQGFLEALVDAIKHEGIGVLTARSAQEGLEIFDREKVDLVTVDIMMPAGPALEKTVSTQRAGIHVCREIRKRSRSMPIICISVVNDPGTIREIMKMPARFVRKGETPLKTVLELIHAGLSGFAYSTDPNDYKR